MLDTRLRALKVLVAFVAVILTGIGLAACKPQPPAPTPTTPIRAAFYYPWFPEAWTQQGTSHFSQYTPTRGLYSTDAATVSDQIGEMQYAGLNVGIASWWGQGTPTDHRIPTLLNAAASGTFKWALYYEPEGVGNPTVSQLTADLSYIKAQYGTSDEYLQIDGKPVIFAFADGSDSCAMADRWAQANADHAFYVDLKVFGGYKTCASQPDSWHQYGPAAATDSQSGYSFSVSPGFWKSGEATPRLVRDPARFTQNVQAMVASKAPWQLITTYNEWGEGTAIEPSTAFGTTYLDILHNVLVGSSPTTTTVAPPPSTTTTRPSTTTTTAAGPTTTTTRPPTTTTTVKPTTTTTRPPTTTTTVPTSGGVCGNAGSPAAHQKVVVFSFENRTWSDVGGTQFGSMPYLNGLAKQCPTFSSYTEPDTGQNSATQYVGTTTGSTANTVRNDCSPSSSCDSTADNIFRQVRTAGLTPRSYVEGATANCSASGNAAKHIPALYMLGGNDHSFCSTEVVPFSQFNPNSLPDFAFVTPTLCNDGHDCSNSTVNSWAASHVQAVLNSAAYKAGQVTVFIWYDEDRPVPNMQLGLHALPGVKSTAMNWLSTLHAWESLLGVPSLGASAANMRTAAGI